MDEPRQYSASSLQDYVDCPRRFYLNYRINLAWPAIESDPVLENEQTMQRGSAFHKIIHQYFLGIPAARLGALVHDPKLERWWENFLGAQTYLGGLTGRRFPETSLSTGISEWRLVAKYDLVLLGEDGKAQIFDWKTGRNLPKQNWMEGRMQTRIYPYLLARSGEQFNRGAPIDPDQIEIIYWFAEHPGKIVRIAYSQEKFKADGVFLSDMIDKIAHLTEADFPMTAETRRCAFCTYRSLCERGERAGLFGEGDEIFEAESRADLEFDFDQIAEISF